jgi:carbamoyl-phosphate synthase small subunit
MNYIQAYPEVFGPENVFCHSEPIPFSDIPRRLPRSRIEVLALPAKLEESGEVVFNTAITGYQEVFTDPSYSGQIVGVLTNPQSGNCDASRVGNKASRPYIEGLTVRKFSHIASNCRSDEEAHSFLGRSGIPVISDIDTRALVRHLRTRGVMRGVLSSIEPDAQKLVEKARNIPTMAGLDLASRVTTRVPALSSAEDVLAPKPSGIFLSNGPSDPEPLEPEVANIRKLIGKEPIFGICLGHRPLLRHSCH